MPIWSPVEVVGTALFHSGSLVWMTIVMGGCRNFSDGVSVLLLSLFGTVALLQVYSGDSLGGSLPVSCVLVLSASLG